MTFKYPKTQTIWKRNLDTGKIIPYEYSLDEIKNIKIWYVTEKIDGTNIRIILERHPNVDVLTFAGRSDKAQIPTHLKNYLEETFPISKVAEIRKPGIEIPVGSTIILFGEGYGYKIQGGEPYRKNSVSFVLFDVWIDGWWLSQADVTTIADKLGIDRVPVISEAMAEQDIINYVIKRPLSNLSLKPRVIEGVVVRTEPLLLLRNGERLIWKLKVKDFDKL